MIEPQELVHQLDAGVEVGTGVAVEHCHGIGRVVRGGERERFGEPAGLQRHFQIVARLGRRQQGIGCIGSDDGQRLGR